MRREKRIMLTPENLDQMSAHLDNGGTFTHQNAVDLLNTLLLLHKEVDKLIVPKYKQMEMEKEIT